MASVSDMKRATGRGQWVEAILTPPQAAARANPPCDLASCVRDCGLNSDANGAGIRQILVEDLRVGLHQAPEIRVDEADNMSQWVLI